MNPEFDLGKQLPTIHTSRLRLRWLSDADVPALLAIFGDAEVMRYWSHEPVLDLNEAREYLREIHECFAQRTLFQWGIELIDSNSRETKDNSIIGTGTLGQLNAEHRRAELGFALARKHWGNGYMAEALPALLSFAFEKLDLHRVFADADPRNLASIRVLERLGFLPEGVLREHYLTYGEKQDAVLFGLLRSEWLRRA